MPQGAANAPGPRLKCSFSVFRRRPLASFAVFCAAGAGAGCCAHAPAYFWLLFGAVFLAVCFWSKRLLALFGAALFFSAAVIAWRSVPPEPFTRSKASVTGVICAEPRRYEKSVCLILTDVTVNGEAYPHRLRLYVYERGEEQLGDCLYGDILAAEGVAIRAPKERSGIFDTDQRRVLWRSGIGATASCDVAKTVLRAGGASPLRLAAQLRAALIARLDALFGEDAPLARALLLGDKTALSDEEYDAFRDAGIVHLLAVSGLHVSVLAAALRWFLRRVFRLSRKASYFAVLPVLALYAAVTGFPPSILRAALLFAFLEAAPLLQSAADPITSLAAAYLLLAAAQPMRQFEAGFLLSFGAMLGLFTLLPMMEAALLPQGKSRGAKAVRLIVRPFLASLAVLLSTLPAASWALGGATLWPLALNLIALPLGSLAVPLLAAATAFSYLWMPLGRAVSLAAALPVRALSLLAEGVAALDAPARLALPRMGPLFAALYFLVFAACSPFFPAKHRVCAARLRVLGLAGLAAVAVAANLWTTLPIAREEGLRVTFIDVGHGDSVLVNAQGRLHMVDTGRGSTAAWRLTASASRLRSLFLTHPDEDHVGGLAQVLRAGDPETVYLPAGWEAMAVADETAAALAGRNIRYIARGDEIALSDAVTCEVLYPVPGASADSDNGGSLAMRICFGEGSLLLLGDLPDSALDGPLPGSDALLLAHHGSGLSSGEWTLLSVAPSAAFLSVGANGAGLPDGAVVERVLRMGIPLFRTDTQGDLTAEIRADGSVSVTTFRPGDA